MALDQEPLIDRLPIQVDNPDPELATGTPGDASFGCQEIRDDEDLVDLRVVAGLGALNGHGAVILTGVTDRSINAPQRGLDSVNGSHLHSNGRRPAIWVRYAVTSPRDALAGATSTAESCDISASDWSVCLIKPDAKAMGIEADIRRRIVAEGLKIIATRELVLIDRERLDKIWPPYDEHGNLLPPNPWWEATVEYMTSAPIDALLVQGSDASVRMKALKAELRRIYYGEGYQNDHSLPMCERVKSIIHTSDCDRELASNASAFWSAQELAAVVGARLASAA